MTAKPAKSTRNARENVEPAAEWLATTALREWPDNPRMNDDNVARVAASIRRFGFGAPIVARREGHEIIAGHTRWRAAQMLGLQRVPVRLMDLPERDAHILALADNRLTELSPWSVPDLQQLLSGLDLAEVELAGWSSKDLEKMASDLLKGAGQDRDVKEDEVPEPPEQPVTRHGDVWELGQHRLVCGDCRVCRPDGKVGTVITDPPYGMSFRSNHREERHEKIAGDGDTALLAYACTLPASHSKYIWCRWDNVADVPMPKSLITWVKNNWSMGDLDHEHARQTEVCLFYPGDEHAWPNGRPRDVVMHDRTGNDLHPTQKPVTLLAEVIGWTKELIHEPFAGSGTTLIAAEQLNRPVFGVEISPAYCDVIVERWQTLTGGKAVRRAR